MPYRKDKNRLQGAGKIRKSILDKKKRTYTRDEDPRVRAARDRMKKKSGGLRSSSDDRKLVMEANAALKKMREKRKNKK